MEVNECALGTVDETTDGTIKRKVRTQRTEVIVLMLAPFDDVHK
ncbi:MAG: hypothetical protein ACTS4Z_01565 [Candidatus Hodgkinia cicadicola]